MYCFTEQPDAAFLYRADQQSLSLSGLGSLDRVGCHGPHGKTALIGIICPDILVSSSAKTMCTMHLQLHYDPVDVSQ